MLGRAASAIVLAGALMAAGCIDLQFASSPAASKPYTNLVIANVTGISPQRPGPGEFYHLQVWGHERAVHVSGPKLSPEACTRAWQFSVNRTQQAISYHESLRGSVNVSRLAAVFTFNLWGVQVYDQRISEGCPSVYEIRGFPSGTPYPSVNRTVGAYGAAEITVFPEGLFAFGGKHFVPLGKKLIVSYGRREETSTSAYFLQGGFEVANLGAWPKEKLLPAPGGVVTKGPG